MILLISAGIFFVFTTFFGIIFMAWYINRDWGKHRAADFVGSTYALPAFAFSLVAFVVYVATGAGPHIDGIEFRLLDRAMMGGFGGPFALLILLIFGSIWNFANKKKRSREARR